MPGQHRNRGTYRDLNIPRGTHLSDTQRVQILTLYHRAKWSKRRIGRELEIAYSTVHLVISKGILLSSKSTEGVPSLITEQQR
jgi:hypothetical protein